MQDTPLNQPAVNELAPAAPQTAQRRMWKLLVLGFLMGCLPAGFSAVLGPSSANAGQTALQWIYLSAVLGLYVGGWVAAVSMRRASRKQSSRVFTKGMMIGLVASVVIPPCALVGFLLLLLVIHPGLG